MCVCDVYGCSMWKVNPTTKSPFRDVTEAFDQLQNAENSAPRKAVVVIFIAKWTFLREVCKSVFVHSVY